MKTMAATPKQSRSKRRPTRKGVATAPVDKMRLDFGDGFTDLSQDQREHLVGMLLLKQRPEALDSQRLIPPGSILASIAAGFADTDINPLIAALYTLTLAASRLTQRGAYLEIANVPPVRPTLWTIVQAASGSSKTLVADFVNSALSRDDKPPVRRMPGMATAAQWLIDLAENNGALWFQDEAGKAFKKVLENPHYAEIKNWMLDAYSHKPISNRLKSEKTKLIINDPYLTFFGMTVTDTWRSEVDYVSMLDGFCQRFNYALVEPRSDKDIFDVFLYESKFRPDLREQWEALCAQKGADGPYTLGPGVRQLLEDWWRSLRGEWGDFRVPASFIRRVGFSTLRYLPVLHFLLGKSAHPIDRETAILATRFAEFHLHSARAMILSYDCKAGETVQLVHDKARGLEAKGASATPRNVFNSMSKAQRLGLDVKAVAALLEAMKGVEVDGRLLPEFGGDTRKKSGAIMAALDDLETRLNVTERKRNERRLRRLVAAHRASRCASEAKDDAVDKDDAEPSERGAQSVLPFEARTSTVRTHSMETGAREKRRHRRQG